ncbi:MAG: helix-turn-helix domain-containing protein [Ruminiclostridium sp.]
MKIKNALDYQLYLQRENDFFHSPYRQELEFYRLVRNGDVERIKENSRRYGKLPESGKGVLSENSLKNSLYHMIINTALITRTCISGGLSPETAYTMSDIYIRRADGCRTAEEINELNDEMTLEFAGEMKRLSQRGCSAVTKRVISYICGNLNRPLTAGGIAETLGYNRSYISTLFKRETGMTIQGYIREKRIETAENILKSTDFPLSDIALSLGFSSQSHFCSRFKEKTGLSPKTYRDKFGAGK